MPTQTASCPWQRCVVPAIWPCMKSSCTFSSKSRISTIFRSHAVRSSLALTLASLSAYVLDDRNHGAHRRLGPRLGEDLDEGTGRHRLHLDGGLVRLDLGERLTALDLVA